MLEDAREHGIPLTASPDGATSRGTIDAKDVRRRSDVQNMSAVDSKVRIKSWRAFALQRRMGVCNCQLEV